MKFNYEQMKENFGIVYTYNDFHPSPIITEEFNVFLIPQDRKAKTYEEAEAKLKDILKENLEQKKVTLNNLIQEFDKLSFFKKNAWRLRNKKMDFRTVAKERELQYQEDLERSQKSIVFKPIDKNKTFTVLGPKILKKDDELFVVVENHNELEIGVYRAKVSKPHYFYRNEVTVDIDGELTIIDNGKLYKFLFRADQNSFVSGHTYHSIFENKEKAIEYYKETIQKKIEFMKQRLEKFDRPNELSKPKM